MNRSTCYHEAGHATVAAQFGFSVRCVKVHQTGTRSGELGRCEVSDMWTALDTDPMRACIYMLSGSAAQKQLSGRPSLIDAGDRGQASLVASCVLELPEDHPRVRAMVARAALIADAMMHDPHTWRAVQAVATALEQKHLLSGRDLQLLVRQAWR